MYTTPGVYAGSVPDKGPSYQGATYAYVALVDPTRAGPTLCLAGGASFGLSFGYLALQTTATHSVTVTNCGNGPLTFSSVTSNNAVFTLPAAGNGCMGSLAVNASCTVSVAFTPTAVQAYTGQLIFTSNASIATTAIPLAGSGGAPSAGFGPPGIKQDLVFPELLVGQTSQPERIALYNNGTVPLTVNLQQIAVTSGFTLAPGGNCTATLAPQQACAIVIEFTPVTAGTINGTLSVATNDPVNPTITTSLTGTAFNAYPVGSITGLLNPSYPINSPAAPITMTVVGTNFFAASVVSINGVAQTTTYQSDTRLSVTFSSSLLTTVGEIPVTVVNPAPGGGASAPYPLLGYLSIPLTASALTVDPVGGLLYAAIPSSASQNPNTVIPINPATGAQQAPIPVAVNPQRLAVSADGSELYVAATGVLQRINLKTLAIERTFNLPGQTHIQEMHVVPGSPQSIVVELFTTADPAEDGAALYNDSGLVNWIPGQSVVNGANTIFWLDSFTFTSSPSVIYGLPTQIQSGFFSEVQVAPTGLSLGVGSPGELSQTTGSMVRSDGSLLYTNSGQVWDPSSQKLLGTYLAPSGSQFFYAAGVLPYSADQHTYFLDTGTQYASYQAVSIDVYDQASYALLGTVPFTNFYPPDAYDLVRWGSNGFAFRTLDATGSQPAANQIAILTSSLVAGSNVAPVPILSSVSPTKVSAGGPAYTMQLTGSGFTSASTVSINGSPRPTTFVSSTSLGCQVQASDIANPGQFNVQVTTPAPGGGTTGSVTVTILDQKPTPALSVTPSAASITSAQALTVALALTGGNGAATPTGTVTLSSGSYTSGPVPLSGGAASIAVPAGTLPVGNDTLTATYSGDGNYGQAAGSASVTVTIPPGFTLSASPATLSVAQGGQGTSTITVTTISGFSGNVTLSATGLPTGVTATFAAGPTAGTQLLTLAAGASAATTSGIVTVGITGASGSVSANTTVALTITSEASFTAGSGSTTAITLTPGAGTGNTATINVAGTNGFSGTVNLTCSVTTSLSNVNDKPVCSLSPTSVSISGSTAQAATLTVTTTPASTAYLWPSAGGTFLTFAMLFMRPRRRNIWNACLALSILLASAGVIACGGGSSGGSGTAGNSGTTPGTYTITVTGTSGVVTATVGSVTLTVQ
jgi:Bacterial Ig-like domain (group 3)